jgi:acyl-CoA synthetase (AMP-forming)/AMP-acid ligase II
MNIVEPILFQAKYRPGAPALCGLGKQVISYAVLRAQMNNVARRAIAYGLKRGSIVALSTDQSLLEATLILGLTQVGIIPVSVGIPPPAGLKIDAIVGVTKHLLAPAAQHLSLDDSWITGDGAPVETTRDTRSESDEVCRIVLTSGTTGDPKAVALTHKLVMARNARFEYLFGSRLPTLSRIYMGLSQRDDAAVAAGHPGRPRGAALSVIRPRFPADNDKSSTTASQSRASPPLRAQRWYSDGRRQNGFSDRAVSSRARRSNGNICRAPGTGYE